MQRDEIEDLQEHQLTQEEMRLQLGLNKHGRPKQPVVFFELTEDIKKAAQQEIDKDGKMFQEADYKKITDSAAKTWDKFYKNHKCNFFKDRKYLEKQIPELATLRQKYEKTQKESVFVELGCGVGNTLFPIHNQFSFLRLYGCDFANSAIKLINEELQKNKIDKIKVEVCDLVKQPIPETFEPGDLVTLIFVLSAIPPENHLMVIQKIYDWMKPGSYFYFRDYGRYDFGQLNMSRKGNRKLKDNFYAKNDGVCVYYFDQEELQTMCEKVGFKKLKVQLHCKLLENRKTGLKMYRVWMQGRFYKQQNPEKQLEKQEMEIQRVQKQQAENQEMEKQEIWKQELNKQEMQKPQAPPQSQQHPSQPQP